MAVAGQESQTIDQLTFEKLFDILRVEKNVASLQKLPQNYFSESIVYLSAKVTQAKNAPEADVGVYDMAVQQLRNARKIIQEIYDRREKKIIALAITKSRTHNHVVDTSNLLIEEMSLYSSLVNLLREFRGNIIDEVLALKQPFSSNPDAGNIKQTAKQVEKKELLQPAGEVQYEVISDVPEFMAPDMTMLGPFKKGDIVSLDEKAAEVLLENGHIKKK